MKPELKPCPCCGGRAISIYRLGTDWKGVQCIKCGVNTSEWKTYKTAIKHWNERIKEAEMK